MILSRFSWKYQVVYFIYMYEAGEITIDEFPASMTETMNILDWSVE